MYRLWNYLFGWDYIVWSNSVDNGIARVHVDYNGVICYWRYKGISVKDKIINKNNYIWLTCEPDKYLKD